MYVTKYNGDFEEAHEDVEPCLHSEALARLSMHVLVQLGDARHGSEAPECDTHNEELVVRWHPK